VDIDRSFERLVQGMVVAFDSWTDPDAGHPATAHPDAS
jgi:hypothetical protein